ncbi:Cadherin-23 [Plecturocebus cupreus]
MKSDSRAEDPSCGLQLWLFFLVCTWDYQLLTVPEHSPCGTLVGNVTGAMDTDEGPNTIIYYFIAGGAQLS